MIRGLTILIGFQILGDASAAALQLPIPGAIIGMLLLLVTLIVRRGRLAPVQTTAQRLLPYLPLILVPVSVGIMTQWPLLGRHWLALSLALTLSLIAGLLTTVFCMRYIGRFGR